MNEVYAIFMALIRRFEGLRLKAYLCPAGVWTLGYGSTGPGIKKGMVWSAAEAEARMGRDAQVFVTGTQSLCPELAGKPLAAISDFSYNLGLTRLKQSTLRRRINARNWPAVRAELAKWTRGGGKVLPGLVARRAAESALLP